LKVEIAFARAQRRAVDERHGHVENRRIACCPDVVGDGRGEPGLVVRDVRTNALAADRKPPMLNVALDELLRRGSQDVVARQLWPRNGERHGVLELIAEAIGTARLIETRSPPIAASKRLIEKPAVEKDVHRAVRRPDLHSAEHVLPESNHVAVNRREIGCAIALDQFTRFGGTGRLPQEKDDLL
jgi:hypothetical protein